MAGEDNIHFSPAFKHLICFNSIILPIFNLK